MSTIFSTSSTKPTTKSAMGGFPGCGGCGGLTLNNNNTEEEEAENCIVASPASTASARNAATPTNATSVAAMVAASATSTTATVNSATASATETYISTTTTTTNNNVIAAAARTTTIVSSSSRYYYHPTNFIPNRQLSRSVSGANNNGSNHGSEKKVGGITPPASPRKSVGGGGGGGIFGSPNRKKNVAMVGSTTTAEKGGGCDDGNNNVKSIGQRCYRLNLERPFDIHCEQSPLEYGDYMAPWSKEVYPKTMGPMDYCPPRHLGGNSQVWQELLRWSSGEEKVNSLDMLDTTAATSTTGESVGAGGAGNGDDISGDRATTTTPVQRRNDEGEEEEDASTGGIVLTMSSSSTDNAAGYQCLTSKEQIVIQKRLGERNDCGEYTFQAYDLTHVLQQQYVDGIPSRSNNNIFCDTGEICRGGDGVGEEDNVDAGQDGTRKLHTVHSMESSTSEDERLYPMTTEEIAQNTARLFRRSELSMREKADGTEKEILRLQRERRRQRYQQQQHQQHGEVGCGSEPLNDDLNTAGGGGEDEISKKKQSRRSTLTAGGKKLFRTVSKALSEMQGTPVPSSTMHSRSTSSGLSGSGVVTCMDKRGSMQALTIDKARDLVDTSHDGEGNAGGEKGNGAKKKPLNVSLYILGEYDILNDLVNDGAKRLRENKDHSDLHLLLQNDPCPPPDRWVRATGWGKCNPGSMYAKYPPEDFDWERYYDKLRLKTGPTATRVVSRDGQQQVPRVGNAINDDSPRPQDGTTDTQSTAVVISSSDLSCDVDQHDEHHHVGGRLTKVTRASPSMPIAPKSPERELHRSFASSVAQSPDQSAPPTRSNTAPATTGYCDARSRFNQPKAVGTLPKSSTTPTKSARPSYAKARSNAQTSTPGSTNLRGLKNNTDGNTKLTFGRKLSSMLGRKKSSGAE